MLFTAGHTAQEGRRLVWQSHDAGGERPLRKAMKGSNYELSGGSIPRERGNGCSVQCMEQSNVVQ